MAYLLKLNEFLDVEDFINEADQRDQEAKAGADAASKSRRRG